MDIFRTLATLRPTYLDALFARWRATFRQFEYEPDLRSDLFSAEQMEQHGPLLAGLHCLSPHRTSDGLLQRLADNEATLASSCRILTAASLSSRRITPAGEWLLDNHYLIEEQIRTARKHLPKGYCRELPHLASGNSEGLPRVYDIALETISHGDGRVDCDSLGRFVAAYQAATPLKLGELWAIPIMLRLALIENLRRVASRVMANWDDRNLADDWADRLAEIAEQDPKSVVLTVADMARAAPPMTSSFVAELARRLQGQSAALALPLSWIEQHLAESGLSIERLVSADAQQQAADQVAISNSIASLRLLSATDWRDFVEGMSHVEQTLHKDPAGVYGAMEFATRDLYRHVVEHLAKHCEHSETTVARTALELADSAPSEDIASHVGYYLIDKGRPELEQRLAVSLPLWERWERLLQRAPLLFFLGPVVALSLGLTWPFMRWALASGLPPYAVALLALPAALMASRLAVSLVNWLVTLTVPPHQLPRLDYSKGIPTEARALVVIPTLIGSAKDIDELCEGLEVRYLANRDNNLHFALLTDFLDASTEVQEQDAELQALAREHIEALNRKYPDAAVDRFFLFHRARRWNPAEGTWMGFERKRGKISELNALLRGTGLERFALIVGRLDVLWQVNYVITLDTDTQLPRDAARQFVGTLAHPLNRARFDPPGRCITGGYAILQPRVGISLPSTARSAYAQLLGSDAGVDPYTRAVSDVYQDLFQQGSFIGKGFYAVDAFEQSLDGHFPDNSILSHDLIEGCYARSGLLSDVQLYEEFPSRYSSDVKRRHRWIRGDWQLLPWTLPWAPNAHGRLERNRLSALSRWKIADNLRRSLEPAAFLAMFLAGWLLVDQPLAWTLAVLAIGMLTPLLASLLDVLRKPHDMSLGQHLKATLRSSSQHFARALLTLAWLPHEAHYSLDAILRTLWRMYFSKSRLLQWSPSREVERTSTNHLNGLYRMMWIGPALALLLASLLVMNPLALVAAAPLLLLWLASPAIAWWMSRPSTPRRFAPAPGDLRFLRNLTRQTWAFFDQYVGPEDNWLPPDNLQEHPTTTLAHRTSPTNIGMAVLANLAAYDFGYLSAARLLHRCDRTLASMASLDRYRRHFYNWYDTQTMQPLAPHYVSTVDSGNLAGMLLTLSPGLLALADDCPFQPNQLRGLDDTLDVLENAFAGNEHAGHNLRRLRGTLDAALAAPPASLMDAFDCLQALSGEAEELAADSDATPDSDAAFWLLSLRAQCADLHDQLRLCLLPSAGDGVAATNITPLPSWRQLAQLDVERWPEPMRDRVSAVRGHAAARISDAERLAETAASLADMDFGFLYDRQRNLFTIGYNVDERRLDASFYDLLASEARLSTFVAVAQGQLPQASWFSLGRLLTSTRGVPVLLSWSGSMFEYLMPLLVMPRYEGTLLDQTCCAAVARQVEYGQQLGLPWGVSESGYNTLDAHFNYQYRAFGVPGLGLKRGLGDDRVVAPYASALALLVAPELACRNLQALAAQGLAGRYGLYEAIDFTPARLPRGQSFAVVRSFMVHHQGMSLLALASLLLDRPMQKRFESDPQFQASALLLQERVPKSAREYQYTSDLQTGSADTRPVENRLRIYADPGRRQPAVQLLSNGRYHVMVSSAGGGYSRCRDLAVTRWHEDATCDDWGMFCYLRDVASGDFWSAAHQPTLKRPDQYEAIFSDARAEFRVRQRDFDAHSEIVVSPEDDIELRRITLTNRARTRRSIEFTSYAEVVLAPAVSDALHRAFSNLFVQTELLKPLQAILCTRRPRSSTEQAPWFCHLLAVHGADVDAISYETDRARFIGRGRSLTNPAAMDTGGEMLGGTSGSVLDPIVAIRCRITLDAGQAATLDLVSGVSDSRDGCLQLIDKYRDRHLADRVFDLAWTHSQVQLRQLNASLADAWLYEQMAASILYANAALRAKNGALTGNLRNQSGLWGQGISGDLPIVLVQITDAANIELVRQLVQAHAYWRQKGLAVDLVIWNEDSAGYRQQLQDMIMGLITSGAEANLIDRPGGIFVRPAQQLSQEDRTLIKAVARIIVNDAAGTLHDQILRRQPKGPWPRFDPGLLPPQAQAPEPATGTADPALCLANAYGGFSRDGSEYVLKLEPGVATPAPWVNVLANPAFGTVISESGGAYTWNLNAHEFRLTPWQNDAVRDASGEAFYLRDDETGHYWSPTPLPRRGSGPYVTRHGFGYSCFEHREEGIESELWVYVALDAPIKYSLLKVRNLSGRPRKLSVTGYVEWVLGDLRNKTAMHLVTEFDRGAGALLARNAYSMEFPGRVAFFAVDPPSRSHTADRSEFIGRNGNLQAPAAMAQRQLLGHCGGGLDPCAALQAGIELAPGASRELVFCLGAEQNAGAAVGLLRNALSLGAAHTALQSVREHWRETLGQVRVETAEPAVDFMLNGWLMYQVIASRFLARSGYYQSGGAYGFRDQLQDSMAMLHTAPASARQHLLLCAAHQFLEGDVQHWWHPPMDRGVRTRCSDDYLWLPLAVSRFVRQTGDQSVLDEQVSYLEGRELNAGEESYYDLPERSMLQESLYQHCLRALELGMPRGAHGLPLMGGGDWNDGMNRVGELGQGESVWLGFFQHEVMERFAVTALEHGDAAFAVRCNEQAAKLRASLEQHGWDGAWYRRAYFDDGSPLGSASNDECRIDSIAQSWSVLSGVAPLERRRQAMDSLYEHLVQRDAGLILLLTPPFDRSLPDPGYIKGYVPGVRENGGQYTHAAVWASMAFAEMGDSARAWKLLDMINPVSHGLAGAIETYKVEPYVLAADVYAMPPHEGRGGWSWYTGAAGWMFRLILESLLGVQREGASLRFEPVLPAGWRGYKLRYRFGSTLYHINLVQTESVPGGQQVSLDGERLEDRRVPLVDDGQDHHVEVHCQPCGPAQPRDWPEDRMVHTSGRGDGTV
ncbi:glycoside hydrolase family 94 protein [Pseudomonas sp. BN102]|uniref:glycoside hydrolase family 94 protein n=1 Tax=Pseudomonas sp. BN102 TaxID=2567886 RepID=UPI002458996C|nr:glycoside hydrolase family 94 protein [Pseudomonas sp. BN102]MDH4609953.1 cyclic beta 1-2 glucan synthetase [Pseudomonas sp. BN102]